MTRRKYDGLFELIMRLVMTALAAASFYILHEVVIMKNSADAFMENGGAVIPTVESVIVAVMAYLIFAFIAAKFRPE